MKMRNEIKININCMDHMILRTRLRALFKPDSHTDAHGSYRVRSIYFDNLYDKVLLEKINGYRYKEKFRIRCYNNDHGYIRLEKKIKIDAKCSKNSTLLSKKNTAQILEGKHIKTEDPLLEELQNEMQNSQLKPKTVVDYNREPFVYPPSNVRITLDTDLRTGVYSRDFLNPEMLLIPSSDEYGILEIKYDDFLPDIVKKAVSLTCRRQTTNSKYAICRRYD